MRSRVAGLVLAMVQTAALTAAGPADPVVKPADGATQYEDLRIRAVHGSRSANPVEGRLGEEVVVEVSGLRDWVGAGNDPGKLALFLNGQEVKSAARVHESRADRLHYLLPRDPDADGSAWSQLLGRPATFSRDTMVTVALPGKAHVEGDGTSNRLPLRILYGGWLSVYLVLLVAAGIAFLYAAARTDLIRDGSTPRGRARRPFSLARWQMAVWFFVVIASYVFIWMVVGATHTLTTELLTLMGISASTALGAAIVDAGKDESAKKEMDQLNFEMHTLGQALSGARTDLTDLPSASSAARTRSEEIKGYEQALAEKQARFHELANALTPVSAGFLMDILSDANGVSLHRFQIALWTLVLVVVFVAGVWNGLTMPTFSPLLLALMGISGATYLGFKYPEAR